MHCNICVPGLRAAQPNMGAITRTATSAAYRPGRCFANGGLLVALLLLDPACRAVSSSHTLVSPSWQAVKLRAQLTQKDEAHDQGQRRDQGQRPSSFKKIRPPLYDLS